MALIPAGDPRACTIRVRLHSLEQLFHTLDPSPFLERDLNDDVAAYVFEWAQECPRGSAPSLVVDLVSPAGADAGAVVKEAVANFFAARADAVGREFRTLMRRGSLSMWIGIAFLVATVLGGKMLGEALASPWNEVLRESLLIGGWVAMWRPLQIYLYEWWPVLTRLRLYRRLAAMDVEVRAGAG